MNTRRIYTLIQTNKFDDTLKFYTDVLGFKVRREFIRGESRGAIIQNILDQRLEISEVNNVCDLGVSKPHLKMTVNDIQDVIKELKEKNVPIFMGPSTLPYGVILSIKDPNGVIISLFQHIR